MRLLEGLQLFGYGNWADIADHVGGGKTPDACKEHYRYFYLNTPNFPQPFFQDEVLPTTPHVQVPTVAQTDDATTPPPHLDLAEGAAVGYMPLRGDFDVEWDDDAELLIADMDFQADESETERQTKLGALEAYNVVLDERHRRLNLIKNHALVPSVKSDIETEKAERGMSTSKDRLLLARLRPFRRFQTPSEHEEFTKSAVEQEHIAERIAHLHDCWSRGVRSVTECDTLLREHKTRAILQGNTRLKSGARGSSSSSSSSKNLNRKSGTRAQNFGSRKRCASALIEQSQLATAEVTSLLSDEEIELCDRILLTAPQFCRAKRLLLCSGLDGLVPMQTAVSLLENFLDTSRAQLVCTFFQQQGVLKLHTEHP